MVNTYNLKCHFQETKKLVVKKKTGNFETGPVI